MSLCVRMGGFGVSVCVVECLGGWVFQCVCMRGCTRGCMCRV